MFVLIALVGILSLLLVVTASVAYLALPRGRLCPQCGGATNPVMLRRLLRLLSLWIQWRWCARCGWEGPGLRGPDLGPLDPPADRDTGFSRGDPEGPDIPNIEDVPTFFWRSGPQEERRRTPSGFGCQGDQGSAQKDDSEPRGFHFRPPRRRRRSQFQWGTGHQRDNRRPRASRPWYLSWLVSKEPPGFQWRERRG